MKLLKQTFSVILLAGLVLLLSSWGHTGHYKINNDASLSFNQAMAQFYQWSAILAQHASDADIRKEWDPSEGPKHYIDIDNYPEFVANGIIPQNLDSVIQIHGYNFVYDQGILPWATEIAVDSLEACFEREDWDQAVLFAADLGHYIADGHMPLHICRNYNGQYSGNNGIHSRYESEMIDSYIGEIDYQGYPINYVDNVNQYIFDYLYANYVYVDSVMAADDYAEGVAGNHNSPQYYAALWDKTQDFTIDLFKNASQRLAELMYTAWVNAGSPLMTAVFSNKIYNTAYLEPNSPNPFQGKTKITYILPEPTNVMIQIRDINGQPAVNLTNEFKPAGRYEIEWNAEGRPGGIYYVVLSTDQATRIRKMVLVN